MKYMRAESCQRALQTAVNDIDIDIVKIVTRGSPFG